MARVGRLAFGAMFTGGAAIHVAIVITGTDTTGTSPTPRSPARHAGVAVVFMPHAALLGLLLVAFELAVGLLILAGGQRPASASLRPSPSILA